MRLAPVRLAPLRFAPSRFAPSRFVPSRFAPSRFAPSRFAKARLTGFSMTTPCALSGAGSALPPLARLLQLSVASASSLTHPGEKRYKSRRIS